MGKATAIARLIRPANLLTALADIVAGWCIAGAAEWEPLVLLGGSSMCLYAGGIALNDVCDARIDARERPERVIPSGALSRGAAAMIALLFLLTGAALAFLVSTLAGLIAAAIVISIVLYDLWLKHNPAGGPAAMGACRGLNLLMGMSAVAATVPVWWPVAALHVLYIGGVTATSRHENESQSMRTGPIIGASMLAITLIGWLTIAFASPAIDELWMSIFLMAFFMLTAPPLARAANAPSRTNVKRAVATGVLGLVALDAAIAAGFSSPVYGLLTFGLLPLGMLLRRRIAVT